MSTVQAALDEFETPATDDADTDDPEPTVEIHDAVAAWFATYDPHADGHACPFCGYVTRKSSWPQHVRRAGCQPAEHAEVYR